MSINKTFPFLSLLYNYVREYFEKEGKSGIKNVLVYMEWFFRIEHSLCPTINASKSNGRQVLIKRKKQTKTNKQQQQKTTQTTQTTTTTKQHLLLYILRFRPIIRSISSLRKLLKICLLQIYEGIRTVLVKSVLKMELKKNENDRVVFQDQNSY